MKNHETLMPCDGVTHEKIKAIYPHIVVGGKPERPCYSIHWYDVESKQMICGFSSYKLSFVRKWLKEEFEDLTVGGDFDNFIQRLQAENERLYEEANRYQNLWCKAEEDAHNAKSEAIKEFAERLKEKRRKLTEYDEGGWDMDVYAVSVDDIDNLVEEMTEEEK